MVKILSGSKPDDLPVERPIHGQLVVNLKEIVLALPPALLSQSDEVTQ